MGATGVERESRDNPDGTTTHRFYQEDVHDFAWTTSPDYLVKTARFEQPGLPPVRDAAAAAARARGPGRPALRRDARGAPLLRPVVRRRIPYPHITVVDPAWQSGAGGMEYPTLFTGGHALARAEGGRRPRGRDGPRVRPPVLVRASSATTSSRTRGSTKASTPSPPAARCRWRSTRTTSSLRFFGGFVPWVLHDIPVTREVDENGLSEQPRRRAARRASPRPRGATGRRPAARISYSKTALWLNTLERHLGWSTLQRIMSTFFSRWKFRHPEAAGLLRRRQRGERPRHDLVLRPGLPQLERLRLRRGRPADRRRWPRPASSTTSGRTAYKAEQKLAGRYRTTVVVRRLGEGVFPVDVVVTFKNGEQGARALGRPRSLEDVHLRARRPRRCRRRSIRSACCCSTSNYANNSRTLEPAGRPRPPRSGR